MAVQCFTSEGTSRKSAPFQAGYPSLARDLSAPLQGGLRFLCHPLPASLAAYLTVCFPSRERYGLTTFRVCHRIGVGALSTPAVLVAHDTGEISPCAHCNRSLSAPLAPPWVTMLIENSHMLALPSTLAPLPLDARRYTRPSRFGRQPRGCRYIVRGLSTVCCLPAVPRRVLVMGHQVRSRRRRRAGQ